METETIVLELLEGEYADEDGNTYSGYGFAAYRQTENVPFYAAEDLSSDREAVEGLIRLLRDEDVSPVHYADVVEDFLT